jgi:hypothetical protein
MKRLFLLELFHKHEFCLTILCCFPLVQFSHSLNRRSTAPHIWSWHVYVKFFRNFFARNILISIHLVYNAQIFFNWQQFKFIADDMFNNLMLYRIKTIHTEKMYTHDVHTFWTLIEINVTVMQSQCIPLNPCFFTLLSAHIPWGCITLCGKKSWRLTFRDWGASRHHCMFVTNWRNGKLGKLRFWCKQCTERVEHL